jgi:hypothetical protein
MGLPSTRRGRWALTLGGASAGALALGGTGAWIANLMHPSTHSSSLAIILYALAGATGAVVSVIKIRTERPADRLRVERQAKLAKYVTDPMAAILLLTFTQHVASKGLTPEAMNLLDKITELQPQVSADPREDARGAVTSHPCPDHIDRSHLPANSGGEVPGSVDDPVQEEP